MLLWAHPVLAKSYELDQAIHDSALLRCLARPPSFVAHLMLSHQSLLSFVQNSTIGIYILNVASKHKIRFKV